MKLKAITVKAAAKYIAEHHRHLPRVQGGLFAVAVEDDGRLCGVAMAGNPARVWQGSGRCAITRVATDGTQNACSALYGALCRAAKALGYTEVWTYTLPGELGASLKASGFEYMGLTAGGEHSRPSRARAPAVRPEQKKRWRRRLAA